MGSISGCPASPAEGIALSLGFLSESRGEALLHSHNVRANVVSVVISRLRRLFLVDAGACNRLAVKTVRDLRIDTPSIRTDIRNLSGGNQQKTLLGRWLAATPSILLLDEPTRGVDVGAKAEIRKKIVQLADQGISVIYVSQDFDELAIIADRVLILADRRLVGELSGNQVTAANIVKGINIHARSFAPS